MKNKIIVAGIGPGHKDFVLPKAKQAIEAAKVLVGGKRALADFAKKEQETYSITADIPQVLEFIRKKLAADNVVVMVSGDPGYYSLLDAIRREFSRDMIEVIPGLSSLQYAFCRLALPWHEAEFLSFHGRRPSDEALKYQAGKMLGLITDARQNSWTIPEILMAHGWPKESYLAVCARLSYADEMIAETTLEKAAQLPQETHAVLVVKG